MRYLVNAATNIGIERETNQDGVIMQLATDGARVMLLAAVCDGMGGLSSGDVAAATVICALKSWFESQCDAVDSPKTIEYLSDSCQEMLAKLNRDLKAYEVQQHQIMGTTLSCIILLDEEYTAIHIGDSRIYQINEELEQLTTDHTTVFQAVAEGRMTSAEAAMSKDRNKLTQCIGASKQYDPEILFGKVNQGEVFLICSDGFRHRLNGDEIKAYFEPEELTTAAVIKERCEKAIDCVMSRREKDNISVAVIKAV